MVEACVPDKVASQQWFSRKAISSRYEGFPEPTHQGRLGHRGARREKNRGSIFIAPYTGARGAAKMSGRVAELARFEPGPDGASKGSILGLPYWLPCGVISSSLVDLAGE